MLTQPQMLNDQPLTHKEVVEQIFEEEEDSDYRAEIVIEQVQNTQVEPTHLEKDMVKEPEEVGEVLQCEQDSLLEWDCDDLYPLNGSYCHRDCPTGTKKRAKRICTCKDEKCEWEYRMPTLECFRAINADQRAEIKVIFRIFESIMSYNL